MKYSYVSYNDKVENYFEKAFAALQDFKVDQTFFEDSLEKMIRSEKNMI